LSARAPAADAVVDAAGRAVLPGFVDSHAHLVFAGERSAEFAARMAGLPYEAGGIRSTVLATRAATDAQLRAGLRRLAGEMLRQGTTTFECKSGYGLTVADEARSVALAAEVTAEVTFLGAHVVPPEFAADVSGYVDLVRGPMLEACAPFSRWADVFCERGAFGADEARAVLTAGLARGLQPRIHANQLGTGQASCWAWNWALPPPTTARSSRTPTWRRSPHRTPWRPCCPAPSSAPGSRTRTRAACCPPGRWSPWPPTAIPAPRTPRACRSASRSRSAICG
jgi:imidazolonepropionase-like amidohydrolase